MTGTDTDVNRQGLPPLLFRRATVAGRRAGLARKAGQRYELCPFRLDDASITRSRQAAAWCQAFADASDFPRCIPSSS